MTDSLPPPLNKDSQPKSNRSCWFVGCGGCLVVLALLVLIGMFIGWQIKRNVVEAFEPIALTPTEEAQVRETLISNNLLTAEGGIPEKFEMPDHEVVLSELEVNYWIEQTNPEVSQLLRVDFEPGVLKLNLRVGAEGQKRILWILSLKLDQTEEGIQVRVAGLKIGMISVPSYWIEQLQEESFGDDLLSDPELQAQLNEVVERIDILKDEILFVPKIK
ncbi:hypothetical protein P3T73_12985 [Kiritimatiellota bacterium B12222]|nr:hypothetical protein P3T73_12985 [Kiritimatiellota bacterium B12222]